jgi:hypothetical protein
MMTRGPRARIGGSIRMPFARPRRRADVLDDARYYPLREELLRFLAEQEDQRDDH